MSDDCPDCQSACASRHSGGRYSFACIACMARLIASARPLKALQDAHIAALARFHGAAWPNVWGEVLTALKA